MMDSFSPVSRKIIAVGLLFLAVTIFASFIFVPVVSTAYSDLARLQRLRSELARQREIALTVLPENVTPVPRQMYISAPTISRALALLSGDVSLAAARRGIEIRVRPAPSSTARAPSTIAMQIEARGDANALLLFLNDIERGPRLVRFSSLTLSVMPMAAGAPRSVQAIPVAAAGRVSLSPPASDERTPSLATDGQPVPPTAPSTSNTAVTSASMQANVIALWGMQ